MQPRVFRRHLFTDGGNSSGQRSATGCAASHPHQSLASSITGLLNHRHPQSPASSVTGLSIGGPGAAAAAAARADSGPPPIAQPAAHPPPQSPASPLSGSGAVAASAVGADSYAQLLADFPAVVNSSKQLPRKLSGDVEHHIVTRGPPLACRSRRLDGEKLAAAKKELLQMERDGIVRQSNSPCRPLFTWTGSLMAVGDPAPTTGG